MTTQDHSLLLPQNFSKESKKDRRMMEEERVINKLFYTTNIVDLFSFYISKPQSLTSRSDLDLLICYRIFSSLNPRLYYTNCFVYVLEQYGVPNDKITLIRSYLVDIYVKI